MLRTTTAALLGSMLLAPPASAATTNDAATECLYDTMRLQKLTDRSGRMPSGHAELQRLLAQAREKAEEGDVAGCRQALRHARSAGSPQSADADAQGGAGIAPADRPEASSGLKTGSETTPFDAAPQGRQNTVRADVGALVQKAGLTQIEGTEVVGAAGETIGEVEAVAQTKDGQQTFLVVGVGGFLGLGDRRIARPLSEFQAGDGKFVLAGADRPSLEDMPGYDEQRYQEVSLPDVLKPLPDDRPGTGQGPPITR